MAASAQASAEFVIWEREAESPWLVGRAREGSGGTKRPKDRGRSVREWDCKEDVNDSDPLAPPQAETVMALTDTQPAPP